MQGRINRPPDKLNAYPVRQEGFVRVEVSLDCLAQSIITVQKVQSPESLAKTVLTILVGTTLRKLLSANSALLDTTVQMEI